MAKWGEGDPRWIVEERPDATNVNNWHWTEKNAAHWSKEKLNALLLGLSIEDTNIGLCSITEVSSIEGEAVANNRKGKLIFFYEWVITCQWKGNVNGDAEEITGKLEIPNLSEENEADEIAVNISLESSGTKADVLKELMRNKGTERIREQLAQYISSLKTEFSKDMIKPTKLSEVQVKTKTLMNGPGTAKPVTISSQHQKPLGVKIDTVNVSLSCNFKCTAEEFYRVLTDANLLQAFTQNKVAVDPMVGGQFSLLDGNISGKFTLLEPNKCIKQNWRIRNWPAEHYSEVTINIKQMDDSTEVSIEQSGVPLTDAERTREGWKRYYFDSIKRTFGFGSNIF